MPGSAEKIDFLGSVRPRRAERGGCSRCRSRIGTGESQPSVPFSLACRCPSADKTATGAPVIHGAGLLDEMCNSPGPKVAPSPHHLSPGPAPTRAWLPLPVSASRATAEGNPRWDGERAPWLARPPPATNSARLPTLIVRRRAPSAPSPYCLLPTADCRLPTARFHSPLTPPNPIRVANAAASLRRDSPSFSKMRLTWLRAVCSLSTNRSAISRLVQP